MTPRGGKSSVRQYFWKSTFIIHTISELFRVQYLLVKKIQKCNFNHKKNPASFASPQKSAVFLLISMIYS